MPRLSSRPCCTHTTSFTVLAWAPRFSTGWFLHLLVQITLVTHAQFANTIIKRHRSTLSPPRTALIVLHAHGGAQKDCDGEGQNKTMNRLATLTTSLLLETSSYSTLTKVHASQLRKKLIWRWRKNVFQCAHGKVCHAGWAAHNPVCIPHVRHVSSICVSWEIQLQAPRIACVLSYARKVTQ